MTTRTWLSLNFNRQSSMLLLYKLIKTKRYKASKQMENSQTQEFPCKVLMAINDGHKSGRVNTEGRMRKSHQNSAERIKSTYMGGKSKNSGNVFAPRYKKRKYSQGN